MKIYKFLPVLLLSGALTSCGEDYLTDMPSDFVTSEQLAQEAQKDAEGTLGTQLKGVYTNWNFLRPVSTGNINDHMTVGFYSLMMLSDVMSNDCSLAMGSSDPWHFDHQLDYYAEQYIRARQAWLFFYSVIKEANGIIAVSNEETAAARAIKAQSLAFRGISYAYLAQFFQHTYSISRNKPCVPIYLTDIDDEPSIYSRATVEQVYARAEKDLLKAIELFDGWQRSSRGDIDRAVAEGLLSRVYLVMHRYDEAAAIAAAAIADAGAQGLDLMTADEAASYNYQDIDNKETVWGVKITDNTTRIYASFASWMSADYVGYGGQVGAYRLIDAALYNSISDTDVRKMFYIAPGRTYKASVGGASWTVPAYANLKFTAVADWLGDVIYMRVAELYLTQAEALARAGRTDEANQVMAGFLRNRDESNIQTSFTADEIYQQRRIELWGEGFGYFDCRRLQKDLVRSYEGTNEPSSSQYDVPWYSYQWNYQLPLTEIQNNNDITENDQNPLVDAEH